ncbi:pilus (MSHA type) biogenesis protein MshL [Shewanella submarina]|uniref:Pilus (MSHA type) biogenesis protein MshL n=1 Tax=Shewanella submarina TaxID=2016376 RepID=A0ABV7GEL7_9GAMM|nr:pilus (MSHA type) biogenesis protein MshL [Shewanella submarina]MCL1035609.1 pilus (MSHA type) biogenesis protein MshL [Shewanella submarina]
MISSKYSFLIVPLFVMGCQSVDRPQPEAAKETVRDMMSQQQAKAATPPPPAVMPDSVKRELAASSLLGSSQARAPSERRFDVSANDVSARVFFASLVQGSPLSVVVHPNVTGEITLSLKKVTLSEALQVVEDMYGFDIKVEGNILRVYPAGMRTETFPLNYLYMQRQGLSITSVSAGRISDNSNNGNSSNTNSSSNNLSNNVGGSDSGSSSQETNGTFIRSQTDTDFWGELQETLTAIIGNTGGGRQVVLSPQAGLVTVRAYPNEIREVRNFLQKAESHLQRQVILEAKVLEVTLSDGYQQGIQWQDVLGHVGSTNFEFGTSPATLGDTITNTLGGITSLKVSGKDFSAMISLLDTQGDVDVLSSPRVTATNNQKAVIKVGKDEYFVTNVSSTTVASATPVTTPDVELTPFFSGIALDVTPQIDEQGNVLLHIHPSVIDVSEQVKQIKVSGSTLELPLAESEIRESDTVIKANSGDVVVIGGLMKSDNTEVVSQIPLLGDIPLLGEAFKNRAMQKRKTELVIMLKPTVVGKDTWQKELERTRDLLDRWYPTEQQDDSQQQGQEQ